MLERLGARFCSVLSVVIMIHAGAAARATEPAAGPAVTTTILPDPFPNVPPVPATRSFVVETGRLGRSPSVLLGTYDVEMDTLSVVDITQPAHGRVTQQPDGTFAYAPEPGFVGADAFGYSIADGRGGRATGRMTVRVVATDRPVAVSRFGGLQPVVVAGEPLDHGRAATVPRLRDLDGDGVIDLVVAAEGAVRWHRNTGTKSAPAFAAGVDLAAADGPIRADTRRVAMAIADIDGDRLDDLVVAAEPDRTLRWHRCESRTDGTCLFGAGRPLCDASGSPFRVSDIRCDVGDADGDGVADVVIGTRSGEVKWARGERTADGAVRFEEPTPDLDAHGFRLAGSYNLNPRILDVDGDGLADLVETDNWGGFRMHLNRGVAGRPHFTHRVTASVTGKDDARVDLHALCDGMLLDTADIDGDGLADLVVGGEIGGRVHFARGRSPLADLEVMERLVRGHPHDLGRHLAAPAHAAERAALQAAIIGLHDHLLGLAGPRERETILDRLLALVGDAPDLLGRRTLEPGHHPGMASLAAQCWLTVLSAAEHDPVIRLRLADAAGFTSAYRRLLLEHGMIYADNDRNPRGAEAIRQWLATVSRDVYPGTCITANDWLGGRDFLLRGHTKNTFNGTPESGGEYGFGPDARPIIGDRGSENQFMTVVHHEASHDLDALVRRDPAQTRRWGRLLVAAGGADMRADPRTGWLSLPATQAHFRESGLWNGAAGDWKPAWQAYWKSPRGAGWREFGFMRGNIPWFYDSPQESLATQGNQHFNSTEGRVQVAADRFVRGFGSNLTEVLFFIDLWSSGLDKVIFYETDDASNQVLRFVRLRRTPEGHIDRLDLGDRRYEFTVDEEGVVTGITHLPPSPTTGPSSR